MIKLYTSHCPQCRVVELKLNNKHIPHEIIDDIELMVSLGMKAAPVIELEDGTRLAFSEAIAWINQQEACE